MSLNQAKREAWVVQRDQVVRMFHIDSKMAGCIRALLPMHHGRDARGPVPLFHRIVQKKLLN